MSGTEEDTKIQVRCKWCGAINKKQYDHYTVKCKTCKKTTAYIINPWLRRSE